MGVNLKNVFLDPFNKPYAVEHHCDGPNCHEDTDYQDDNVGVRAERALDDILLIELRCFVGAHSDAAEAV